MSIKKGFTISTTKEERISSITRERKDLSITYLTDVLEHLQKGKVDSINISFSPVELVLDKGQRISFLGFEIINSYNNDGIVLSHTKYSGHLGNYGIGTKNKIDMPEEITCETVNCSIFFNGQKI